MEIREYDSSLDRDGLRRCVVELQDFERGLDPRLPPGSAIADGYIEQLLRQNADNSGRIFVALGDGLMAGFVCVWARARSDDVAEAPREYALVKDLVVLPEFRNRGLGRKLLQVAEDFARRHEARYLRISVLAANAVARELYLGFGFQEREVWLDKALAPAGA